MFALATRVSPKSCLPYMSQVHSLAASSLADHPLGRSSNLADQGFLHTKGRAQPMSIMEELKNPPMDSRSLLEDMRRSANVSTAKNKTTRNTNLDNSFIEGIHSPVFLPKPEILFASKLSNSTLNASGGAKSTEDPNEPDLKKVSYLLTYDLLNTFIRPMDWTLYHGNIIFEDNIRGKKYEGVLAYRNFVNLLKIYCHMRFVYVRFNILNVTEHPEDGTIRVRWRIAGMGAIKMVVKYIPAKMWQRGSMDRAADTWYDGYSTFYVNSENKIVKHRADKVIPDGEAKKVNLVDKLKRLKPTASPAL